MIDVFVNCDYYIKESLLSDLEVWFNDNILLLNYDEIKNIKKTLFKIGDLEALRRFDKKLSAVRPKMCIPTFEY